MNVGLREAKTLTDIMAAALRDGDAAKPLQEYNRRRLAEWRSLLGLAGGLRAEDQSDPWVQRCSERLLPCLPASGADLAALAQQLGLKAP